MRRIMIGLALASSLALAACSSSGSSSSAQTAAPGSTPTPAAGSEQVTIAGFAFAPASITVKVGTTVTWTNEDAAPHTVTAVDGSFKSGSLAKGATFSQTFAKAGTYQYGCDFHSAMKGTVTVAP